jgi:uncharacterized protein YqeY
VAIESALQAELTSAMRRRDAPVVAALRTALAALANAQAVPAPEMPPTHSVGTAHVAGATQGLGAAEVPRLTLTEQNRLSIVAREAAELTDRVERLTRLCRRDEADGARRALSVLTNVLDAST